MRILIKILIIITILVDCLVYAEPNKLVKIYVFHINGINTLPEEAIKNLEALQDVSDIEANFIVWGVLYNPTHGLLASDLWDTFRMKKQEGKDLTIDDYVQTYMNSKRLSYPYNSEEYQKLRDEIKPLYLRDPSFIGLNFEEILNQFHQKIPSPYKVVTQLLRLKQASNHLPYVLLLPHSQGNQYANQLWEYLINVEHFPKNHIKTFGIATPTSKLNGSLGDHVTAKNDYVINSLRVFSTFAPSTQEPMLGNVRLTCKDMLCHSLIDAYLYDNKARELINYHVGVALLQLFDTLIETAKKQHEINFLFSQVLTQNNVYQILDNSGKIICDAGKCNPDLLIYKFKMDSFYAYGYLNTGKYYIVSKNLHIQLDPAIVGFLSDVTGYFYLGHNNYGGDCTLHMLPVSQSNDFSWHGSGLSISLDRCKTLPNNVYINGNIILAQFTVW